VVLHHKPYQNHVGNESVAEETMYLVTGLQVRKRTTDVPVAKGDDTAVGSGSSVHGESSGDGIDSDSNNSNNSAWDEGSDNSDNSQNSENSEMY